jgi:colicin import membrane protein
MASDYQFMTMIEQYERQAKEHQRQYNDHKKEAAITTDPNKKQELLKEADLHKKKAIDAQAKAEELKKYLTQREERQRERERFATKSEVAKEAAKAEAKAQAKAQEEARKTATAKEAAKVGNPQANLSESERRIKGQLEAMQRKREMEVLQKMQQEPNRTR